MDLNYPVELMRGLRSRQAVCLFPFGDCASLPPTGSYAKELDDRDLNPGFLQCVQVCLGDPGVSDDMVQRRSGSNQ